LQSGSPRSLVFGRHIRLLPSTAKQSQQIATDYRRSSRRAPFPLPPNQAANGTLKVPFRDTWKLTPAEEEGIRDEVEAVAIKRVLAWQLSQEMKRQRETKLNMARELHSSRSQLDRLLDPNNIAVSLETMTRAAHALGKSLVIRIDDRPQGTPKSRTANELAQGKRRPKIENAS